MPYVKNKNSGKSLLASASKDSEFSSHRNNVIKNANQFKMVIEYKAR